MVGPAAERGCTPKRRGGEPGAEIEYGPGVEQEHAQAGGGEKCVRLYPSLPPATDSHEHRQRGSPGGRSRPPEKRDVCDTGGGGDHERENSPHPDQAAKEENPRGYHAHVESRDRKQVHQPRLGESILKRSVHTAPPSQDQRVDQRCARPIEPAACPAQRGSKPSREGGLPGDPVDLHNDQGAAWAAGPPGARGPACAHLNGEPSRTRPALRPSGRDRARAARPERLYLQQATVGLRRLEQAQREAHRPGRQPRRTAPPLLDPVDLAAEPPESKRGAQHGRQGPAPREPEHERDPNYPMRSPKTQKAGRETGPICHGEQNGRPEPHYPSPIPAAYLPEPCNAGPPKSFAAPP